MTDTRSEPSSQIAFQLREGPPRSIEVTELLSLTEAERLLHFLKQRQQRFALYDPLYPSDPGAYFSYSPENAVEGVWQMTLGNHGWSGGIYQIGEQTLCLQLSNLAAKRMLTTIEIEGVTLFSYALESVSKNSEINQRLRELHG